MMRFISFTWDHSKNKLNTKKHKVSFEEAKSVFYDENAIEFYDLDHSEDEDRYLLIGLSERFHIIIVSYSFQKESSVIRIISARKATKKETQYYHGG
jgi:uncharacterized DUF497 family protein